VNMWHIRQVGTTWLTGGTNIERTEKVEAGDRWWTHITLEGVNPLLTNHVSGIRKGGARGFNTPTHKFVSCERC
jgi:hypothetical protein